MLPVFCSKVFSSAVIHPPRFSVPVKPLTCSAGPIGAASYELVSELPGGLSVRLVLGRPEVFSVSGCWVLLAFVTHGRSAESVARERVSRLGGLR